jgi:hypothetical protein
MASGGPPRSGREPLGPQPAGTHAAAATTTRRFAVGGAAILMPQPACFVWRITTGICRGAWQ